MRSKLKLTLFCAVSAVALSTAAHAQSAASDTSVEAVVVTGSRVISDVANSPTPLTVVSTEELQANTPTNIPDALNKLPVFLGSGNPRNVGNVSSNASGNVLNLRNFGAQRTLVLLDGHRVAPSNANGTVDTDTLPQMLMSRVDVVTGGASAVYGSDAVSGVVNFILDKNFTGIKYNASAGISNYSDAAQYQAGLAAGTDLFGGRGHLEGSVRYFHQDMVPMSARPYGSNGQAWILTGDGTAAHPYVSTPYARQTVQGENGLITCACAANGMQFIGNGLIGPFNPGTPTANGGIASGGDGAIDRDSTFQTSLRTAESFARFSYKINDDTSFYIQGSAAEAGNFAVWDELNINPSSTRPNTFYVNNPYLPAAAQALLSSGNSTGTFHLAGRSFTNIDGIPASQQGRLYDSQSVDRSLSVTAGLDGVVLNKYEWSLYYTHGESRQKETQPNNTNNQKLYASMDAVLNSSGNPVCYVSTTAYASLYPGCVPINPFGPTTATSSQYDYVSEPTSYVMTNTLDDVGGSIAGEIFDLPAGAVKAALSAEMRWADYNVASSNSPTATVNCTGLRLCNPATGLYVQNIAASVNADNNVYEFAGEVNVPVVKDLPLVQSLAVDLAGRYTNYSTSGAAETWKIGLDYHVDDNVRFRGAASVDIRAPTLSDLFQPLLVSNSGFTDLLTNQTFSVPVHTQGNSALQPEVAHTYTAGLVFTPTTVPGLTVSVDYYRINLAHAITSISYGTTAIQQLCQSSGGSSPYCALVSRPYPVSNTSSANFPNYIVSESLNSANVKTEGVDLEVDYSFSLADIEESIPGDVTIRNLATNQPYVNTTAYPGAATNFTSMPKGRVTSMIGYTVGSWGINLQNTWMSGFSKLTLPGQVYTQPHVNSFDTLDVTIDKKFTSDDNVFDLYLSVQNIGNTQPPLDPTNTSTPGQFYPASTYESGMGRYFLIGVRGNL